MAHNTQAATDLGRLLSSKTRCLVKFRDLTAHFAASCAPDREGFAALDEFQNRRAETIRALELYDRKINEVIANLPASDRTPALQAEVEASLSEKETIIHEILRLDERILQAIEAEKARLLKELSASEKSKNVLRKFKSASGGASGEELDRKL